MQVGVLCLSLLLLEHPEREAGGGGLVMVIVRRAQHTAPRGHMPPQCGCCTPCCTALNLWHPLHLAGQVWRGRRAAPSEEDLARAARAQQARQHGAPSAWRATHGAAGLAGGTQMAHFSHQGLAARGQPVLVWPWRRATDSLLRPTCCAQHALLARRCEYLGGLSFAQAGLRCCEALLCNSLLDSPTVDFFTAVSTQNVNVCCKSINRWRQGMEKERQSLQLCGGPSRSSKAHSIHGASIVQAWPAVEALPPRFPRKAHGSIRRRNWNSTGMEMSSCGNSLQAQAAI